MNDSISVIGANVLELRDALGLSQKKFSELIDISAPTLVNIESGKKSFRIKSLTQITTKLGIALTELSSPNFIPPKGLRDKLIEKYKNEPSVYVIINDNPSIAYVVKYKILITNFLNEPKEINEIKKYLDKCGYQFKGNSLHQTIKRLSSKILIEPHPRKKNTFTYRKRALR